MKLLDKDGLTYYTGKIKNQLTDYVKNTDYATNSKGGVFRTNGDLGTFVTSDGTLTGVTRTYEQYLGMNNNAFIGRKTLENVITGKGLVSNTDYATTDTGGVVKIDNFYGLDDTTDGGKLRGQALTYANYQNKNNFSLISKGTLENVLTEKIGNIQTLLDNLNTGSGV